jgi:hypothetical protein
MGTLKRVGAASGTLTVALPGKDAISNEPVKEPPKGQCFLWQATSIASTSAR